MRILAYGTSHDGAIALLENERLSFSLESEKDSGPRYAPILPPLFLRSLRFTEPLDVVAFDSQPKADAPFPPKPPTDNATLIESFVQSNYLDETAAAKTDSETLFAGRTVRFFTSSHVRCHIMCAFGLSPFPQGQACYALIWEGLIGGLYYIDESACIHKIGDALLGPGDKYKMLYGLADPTLSASDYNWMSRMQDPGKLMALAAYGAGGAPSAEQQNFIDAVMALDLFETHASGITPKARLNGSRYIDIGVEAQEFKDLAWQFSKALFDRFYRFTKTHVSRKLPLVIAGGCGLNCEWNTRWRECGLFTDVFVPPCANDSGLGIGAAIDALHHYTGRAKIEWSVYAGESFVMDEEPSDFKRSSLDLTHVCRRLLRGDVIAWVQGRYEMGPRALGNRSLLAAPFSTETRDRLNRIKQREAFRPIAPICLEEDFDRHFANHGPSPYMLEFHRVRSADLAAVTHVDGSARAQSINDRETPLLCALLREFRSQGGAAVLCNTSLNFKGCGFINRSSHLFTLARETGIDGLVVGTDFWTPRRAVSD